MFCRRFIWLEKIRVLCRRDDLSLHEVAVDVVDDIAGANTTRAVVLWSDLGTTLIHDTGEGYDILGGAVKEDDIPPTPSISNFALTRSLTPAPKNTLPLLNYMKETRNGWASATP